MLLTSGQISMTISSCVVFIFTSLLFLSGYVLQQQTVRSLQAAIHPPPPPPPPPPNVSATVSANAQARIFGQPPGSNGHAAYQRYLGGIGTSVDWKKAAYVQIVTKHMLVCNAIMVFAELARQKSPARRVLLYPKRWDIESAENIIADQRLERTMRLIKVGAVRHGVTLAPIDPMLDGTEDDAEETYPICGLLSLTSFDQLLFMRPSGLIIDSSSLDAIFALRTNSTFTSFAGLSRDLAPMTLIKPSNRSFVDAMSFLRSNPNSESTYIRNTTHFVPAPSTSVPLVSQTFSLASAHEYFDATKFVSQAGYVQLSDPDIPGPEYNVPRSVFLKARPEQSEARRAWEELYETYRMRRMDVCGLDLEPIPIVEEVGVEHVIL